MLKNISKFIFLSGTFLIGCGGDDSGGGPTTAATYEINFTNKSTGQLMTPPVVAIHSTDAHLFEVGQRATIPVIDIAEQGDDDALLAFLDNPTNSAAISASAVVGGSGPIAANESRQINITTNQDGQVLSAVNMIICTNDGIAGFDSVALPLNSTPQTYRSKPYDAGTRENQADANSFFPVVCRDTDSVGAPTAVNEAPKENPQLDIASHAGQTGIPVRSGAPAGANWDFMPNDDVLEMTITRQ